MAEIPHPWGAYARLQKKLAMTSSITIGAALEEALNVVLQSDFSPESIAEINLHRVAANAARQQRHRSALRCQALAFALDEAATARQNDDGDVSAGPSSLDDAIHARRELLRVSARLPQHDWDLLTDVAAGVSYSDLAVQFSSTSAALRSRVCRLRQVINMPTG